MNAMKAYEHALQALEFDEARRPPAIRATDGGGLTADQLRELANTLDATAPPLDAGLEATYGEAQVRLRAIERSSFFRRVLAGLALAGVFGGAGVWALWNPWIGAALVLSCAIAFVLLVYRSGYMRRARAVEDLVKAQAQLLSQRKAVEDANEKVKAARVHISGLGLPADGTALRNVNGKRRWIGQPFTRSCFPKWLTQAERYLKPSGARESLRRPTWLQHSRNTTENAGVARSKRLVPKSASFSISGYCIATPRKRR
jgi:hypothetical protein